MKIGSKIRKVRELRGLSQENLADELGMSSTGYGKIERDEVSVSFDRLQQISKVLGVDIENIIGFDENIAFNNFHSTIEWQVGNYSMPVEMKKLYEDKITLLEDKVKYLEDKILQLSKDK